MTTEPHGMARLEDGGKKLVITTMARRGKTFVPNVQTYVVEDCRPDPEVCSPAFSLTKETGEVYHCGANEFGVFCDCPQANYRGANSRVMCKHCAGMCAVGLLPRSES